MTTYSNVQFLGYALPTIPAGTEEVGDSDQPIFITGRYLGLENPKRDIRKRVKLIKRALRRARRSACVEQDDPDALKVFVVPEFSIRGVDGAYNNDPPDLDYFEYFMRKMSTVVKDKEKYKDWLLVIGTVVTTAELYNPGADTEESQKARVREQVAMALGTAWQWADRHNDEGFKKTMFGLLQAYTAYCHSDPLCEVRNRCYIIKGGSPGEYPDGLSVEKKFISNEDFILNFHSKAFSEEDVSYPYVDNVGGENKKSAFDDLGVFTIDGVSIGVEICLDHAYSRLRRHLAQDNPIQLQVVPSCGLQLMTNSIAAVRNGLVFNCDGQYGAMNPAWLPGAEKVVWGGKQGDRSHTELTMVETPCGPLDEKEPSKDAAVATCPDVTMDIVEPPDMDVSRLYAHGPGQIHVYGKAPIPPMPGKES